MKNPVGRPRTTLNDLPQNWQLTMQEMGREGHFDVDVRVALSITKEMWYTLIEHEPEFAEAVNNFRELSHNWWNSIPRMGFKTGKSKDLNSNLYSLIMRNRFKDDWNQTQTSVDITTGGEKIDNVKKFEIEIIKNKIDGESQGII